MATHGGTRIPNLRFRRPTPYPLGHAGTVKDVFSLWGIKKKKLRRPGIEPGSQEWESCMIPLHQRRFISKLLSARLAQSVEHETLNLRVVGSSPTLGEMDFCKYPAEDVCPVPQKMGCLPGFIAVVLHPRGCSSVVERMLSMYEAPSSILGISKVVTPASRVA